MDRNVTREWLPDNFSLTVLEVVGACCRSLLELLKPRYIYRVTFMSEPTEKALAKHDYITNIMNLSVIRLLLWEPIPLYVSSG